MVATNTRCRNCSALPRGQLCGNCWERQQETLRQDELRRGHDDGENDDHFQILSFTGYSLLQPAATYISD